MIDPQSAAKILNGQRSGKNSILCPGPSHGKRDRSLSVKFDPKYPEGFAVHSFSGDTWQDCRDYVRDQLGLPAWERSEPQVQPVFAAAKFVYEDSDGEQYQRIDHLSDGSFRSWFWDIDGWYPGEPAMPIPYALPDLSHSDTVWLVWGEPNADLIRDGFGEIATTYPTSDDQEPDPSFLHHLRDKTVHVLNAGGSRARAFADKFSRALNVAPVHLPEGCRTLRDYAKQPDANLNDLLSLPPVVESVARRIVPTSFEWVDPDKIPPRPWIYGRHFIRGFVTLTVSPGGVGKSSLVTVEALAMASGRNLLVDDKVIDGKPLRVWYWNGEDPQEETRRRFVAAAKLHKVEPDEFVSRLWTDTGREQGVTFGSIENGSIKLDEELFNDMEAVMLERQIDVLLIDPFVSSHRMGENDNGAIDAVVKRLNKLAERTNAAIEIVHHVRKPAGGSTAATEVNDARGASALLGGVRSARALNVMDEATAKEYGIPLRDRYSYFMVTNGKSNMAKRDGSVCWRFMDEYDLCNDVFGKSDVIGVATHYQPPADTKSLTVDMIDTAKEILARDRPYKFWSGFGPVPKDWIGIELAMATGKDPVECKKELREEIKTWLSRGIATLVEETDEHGNKCKYVRPAVPATHDVPVDFEDNSSPF